MPNFDDIYALDYTADELKYFENEMRKYKLPWITKAWKKYGVPFIRYSILPVFIILFVLFIIYNSVSYGYEWIWDVSKAIVLFYILVFGIFTLVAHVSELISTNRLRKRLGLSKRDFNILVITFQITGM